MTSSCIRQCVEINELSSAVRGLSIEQLLLMALHGACGSLDEVMSVLNATNWEGYLEEMKMIESERS